MDASLEMTLYPDRSSQFPSEYDGDAFAAEHGSWNRDPRAGYEVVLVPMESPKKHWPTSQPSAVEEG